MLDILFVSPSNSKASYQVLSNKYSAIETPTWALLLSESCRSIGYSCKILDANAESLSLEQCYERVIKFYNEEIEKKLKNKNILISAHGNSIRALCKYLFKLDNSQISDLEIPTANPLMVELNDKNEVKNCKYLDKERAKNLLVF